MEILKKHKAWLIAIAVVFLFAGAVQARTSLLEMVAEVTGVELADRIEERGFLDGEDFEVEKVVEEVLGLGVHARSAKQLAIDDTLLASTTVASLLNSDGQSRIIESLNLYIGNTATTSADLVISRAFDIATSTDAFTSSTYNGLFQPTTFSTSTDPQWFNTSTFSNVIDRTWGDGVYLNVQMGTAASTSDGFLAVEYYSP